jgi:hypothetical protein
MVLKRRSISINADTIEEKRVGHFRGNNLGQELLAFQYQSLSVLHFWGTRKEDTVAVVDYLFPSKVNSYLLKLNQAAREISLTTFVHG